MVGGTAVTYNSVMNQAYSQELRTDTTRILIPVLSAASVLTSLILTISSTSVTQVWHFWVIAVVAPLGGWVAWELLQRERVEASTDLFLIIQLGILSLLLYQEWQPGGAVPYFFGVIIIASSMFKRAETGLLTWGASSFIILVVAALKFGIAPETVAFISGPILVNLALAAIAYLSAMEWQYAVESVSDLHRNVQRRRDELFTIQEELQWTNAKLESTNRKLDRARQEALDERDIRTRFMNHVSHELRTPLNSIVNFAHIVRLGGRGTVTEGQIDYLERIEKSGWHLLSVLNDLLDMAQIQAGEFKLQLEVCDLHVLCEETMTTTRGLLLESEVDLVRDYPEAWPSVIVDKMRLKQSLINLLGNAVKYTEEGAITLRVSVEGDEVYIAVQDTGIGIPPEHHESIFKEFHQVNESPARKRIGTGLGLPITKHLIERHGGRMYLESEPGKGSTFVIVLPLAVTETPVDGAAGGAAAAEVATNVMATAVTLPAEPDPEPVAEPPVDHVTVPDPLPPTAPLEPVPPEAAMLERPTGKKTTRSRLPWVAIALVAGFILLVVGFGVVRSAFGNQGSDDALTRPPTVVAVIAPTDAPTATPEPSLTPVPPTETATLAPTATDTAVPTQTAMPTAVPTDIPTPTPTTAVTPTVEMTNMATALVSASLYQTPDASSAEVTFVDAGDQVTVSGRSENGNWLYVVTADGEAGFVFGDRVTWSGDVAALPIVSGSTDGRGAPVTSALTLDLYPLSGTGQCEGQRWTQSIFMRGQGGNGTYTYFWNGQQLAANVVNDGVTVEVSHTGGALTGVGEVISGGVSVTKELFITPPDCG